MRQTLKLGKKDCLCERKTIIEKASSHELLGLKRQLQVEKHFKEYLAWEGNRLQIEEV